MEKKIKISATFDTQEFDRELRRMKDKLKEMYQPANTAMAQRSNAQRMGGGLSAGSEQAFKAAAKQDMRELDSFIQKQAASQEKINKAIDNRLKTEKLLKKQQDDAVKGSEKELKLKQEILKTEESLNRLRSVNAAKATATTSALDARDRIAGSMGGGGGFSGMDKIRRAYSMHGMSGAAGMAGRVGMGMFRANPGGIAGAALGGIGSGMQFAGQIMHHEAQGERLGLTSGASAVQGAGVMSRNILQGQGSRNAFWAPEQMRAMNRASKEMEATRNSESMSLGGGLLKSMGVGAGLGAAGGAMFAGVGAIPGALVGGALGLGKGLYSAAQDPRSYNKMLGAGGFGSDKHQARYESSLGSEMFSNYKQNLEAEKEMSPLKKMGRDYHEANWQRNLGASRSLGYDGDDLTGAGGMYRRSIEAGFSDQQGLGMSGQISGAGGSTRMARTPEAALRMQRQMNITNAGGIMGKLSGTLGGAKESESATIKILAEGMKKGLDSSEFVGEQRKFSATVAQMVYRSGATTEAGAGGIAKQFGSFLMDKTMSGIQGATTAYNKAQDVSRMKGGIRGAIQMANIGSDPNLNQMSHDDKMAFAKLTTEDILAGGPQVEAMAAAAGGISVEEFQKIALKTKSKHTSSRESTDKAGKAYVDAANNPKISQKVRDELLGTYTNKLMGENNDLDPMNMAARKAYAGGQAMLQFGNDEQQDDAVTNIKAQLARKKKGSGVAEEGAAAKSSGVALDQFNLMKDRLEYSANAFVNATGDIIKAQIELAEAYKVALAAEKSGEGVTAALENFKEKFIAISKEMDKGSTGLQQPDGGASEE